MARPRTKATTARSKTKPTANKPKWTKEQLVYLAGVWSGSLGLKSPGDVNPVAISKDTEPTWPQFLAETYGGEAKSFTARSGKAFFGWYVSNELKLEFLDALEKANVLTGVSTNERDGIRGKLNKAITRETGGRDS